MENLIQSLKTKIDRPLAILYNSKPMQCIFLGGYLLLGLLYSGWLSILWMLLGVGLGWLLGRNLTCKKD